MVHAHNSLIGILKKKIVLFFFQTTEGYETKCPVHPTNLILSKEIARNVNFFESLPTPLSKGVQMNHRQI